MTTLTITLDDSPEAQLIIQLLKQTTVVTSLREDAESLSAPTEPDFPVIWRGNPSLRGRPTESVWDKEPPTVDEIRRRDWGNYTAAS
jgi:hypothetical protein